MIDGKPDKLTLVVKLNTKPFTDALDRYVNAINCESREQAIALMEACRDCFGYIDGFDVMGNSIFDGIARGMNDAVDFIRYWDEKRTARNRYYRMCANMPAPRKRKHGGRWPKRKK